VRRVREDVMLVVGLLLALAVVLFAE